MSSDNDNDGNPEDKKPKKTGYKNPPKEHRFKKGQSGNPNGRPKNPVEEVSRISSLTGWQSTVLWPTTTDALRMEFIHEMMDEVDVKKNGVPVKMSFSRALILAIKKKALNGCHRSQKLLLETNKECVGEQERLVLELMEKLNEIEENEFRDVNEASALRRKKRNEEEVERLRKEFETNKKKDNSDEE